MTRIGILSERDVREHWNATRKEGATHHEARFIRRREVSMRQVSPGRFVPHEASRDLAEFAVTFGRYGARGTGWWHVYLRMNNNNLQFLRRFAFREEACEFIAEMRAGRNTFGPLSGVGKRKMTRRRTPEEQARIKAFHERSKKGDVDG